MHRELYSSLSASSCVTLEWSLRMLSTGHADEAVAKIALWRTHDASCFFLLLFVVVLYRLVRSVQMMLRCLSLNSVSEFSFVTKTGHFFLSLPIVVALILFCFLFCFSAGVGVEIYFSWVTEVQYYSLVCAI